MKSLKINGDQHVGGVNLIEKKSWVPAVQVQELWNAWEIHCLVLVSLLLQAFLFLFAGMRRRSSSWFLGTALWLSYLSADSVAIYVLGHLTFRSSEAGHQLMSLWAPFMLVHLGGQRTITALSKQDSELRMRHLLSLVSQMAASLYVMAKASLPDGRLNAAMVLVFLSGCVKYAERSYCLYRASPAKLRSDAQGRLQQKLYGLQRMREKDWMKDTNKRRVEQIRRAAVEEVDSSEGFWLFNEKSLRDILSVDTLLNDAGIVSIAENDLHETLEQFGSSAGRCKVYDHVGALLQNFYLDLYTKNPISKIFYNYCLLGFYLGLFCCCTSSAMCDNDSIGRSFRKCMLLQSVYTFLHHVYVFFNYVSIPVALVLFWAAEKGDKGQLLQHHSSRADIIVCFILLVGAIVLDVSSLTIFIISKRIHQLRLPAAWTKKQYWSEELAQYSMIKRHVVVVQDTNTTRGAGGMASIQQWVGRRLGSWGWGVGLLDLIHSPIAQDHKQFILDILLYFGTRRRWNIASSRGRLALQDWMRQQTVSPTDKKSLVKTMSSRFDFPASVIIWHIATHICYYSTDASTSTSRHKHVSRDLSNYVTYLVFKCGVMLTTNSQLVHDNAHDEISEGLSAGGHQVSEEDAVKVLFEQGRRQDHSRDKSIVQERQVPVAGADDDDDDNAALNQIKKLQKHAEAFDSPVLPEACAVAQELIDIGDETERWHLIASVWSEMLFYTAPRYGAAFHYEHLSTGGEFITHGLLLMLFLGPFLPPPAG